MSIKLIRGPLTGMLFLTSGFVFAHSTRKEEWIRQGPVCTVQSVSGRFLTVVPATLSYRAILLIEGL